MKICQLLVAGWLLLMSFTSFAQLAKQDPNAGLRKYNQLMQIIKYAYVDSVDEGKLVERSIVEMLKELDPHSFYISKKDVMRANEELVGNFEGIGVQFEILRDTINIVHPIPGGPSEKLGIMAGDKIVKIEAEEVAGKKITNQFVFDRLRGKKGTKVNITILRPGMKDLMEYTIIRDKIPINSIDAAYMITPQTGYINLTRFSSTSDKEFDDAIEKMKKEGLRNLILDLRGNGGGYLNTAFELADEFLPEGKLIVYTQGLRSPREDYLATAKGDMEQGKVIILINEGSASASEIVAGAIQDWDRGLVMGRRSFGKGLVQRPFQLPDSSQVRLTTAKYYTPSGRNIQKPYSEGIDKYYQDYANRLKHGELVSSDSIHFPDSLKFYTSQKRLVYGGGGIMPDIFLPLDTTKFTQYYMDLRRKNVINLYLSEYIDKNRNQLQKNYPDFKSFDKNFKVDDNVMKGFFDMADKQGVKKNEEQYKISEDFIKNQIKALIAQKLWDTNAFYVVINHDDDEIQRALKVMDDDSMFKKLTSK